MTKRTLKRIISAGFALLTLLSITSCNSTSKMQTAESTVQTTEKTTVSNTTTMPTTTKEKVLLLSLCPTYEEYIEKLENNIQSIDVERNKESKDNQDMMSATVNCSGGNSTATITILYSKANPHSIQSVTVTTSNSVFSSSWWQSAISDCFELLYLYFEDIPTSISLDTLLPTLSKSMKKEEKEYLVTMNSSYKKDGIRYLMTNILPNQNSSVQACVVTAAAQIDDTYMIDKP